MKPTQRLTLAWLISWRLIGSSIRAASEGFIFFGAFISKVSSWRRQINHPAPEKKNTRRKSYPWPNRAWTRSNPLRKIVEPLNQMLAKVKCQISPCWTLVTEVLSHRFWASFETLVYERWHEAKFSCWTVSGNLGYKLALESDLSRKDRRAEFSVVKSSKPTSLTCLYHLLNRNCKFLPYEIHWTYHY